MRRLPVVPHPPAAQIEQQVDALVADMLRGCQMPQRSDIVHARCLRQARANVAAIVRAGCKQLHLQVRLASPQRFEQGHRQQARRVGAKAVGHESELQRAAAAQRGRWQWVHGGGNRLRAGAGARQLLRSAGVLAQERERLHGRLALRYCGAHLCSQGVQLAPIAQAASPVEQLCGDVGLVGQQLVGARIGGRGLFRLACIFERVPKPQGDPRMLRYQVRGLLEQRGRFCMALLRPAYPSQPRHRFRMARVQRQRALHGRFAGSGDAHAQLGIGQHQPGDEIARLASHLLAQLQQLARDLRTHGLSLNRASSSA